VRAAVLAAPDLTERQKQVLLEIYESFRQEMTVTAEVISVRGGEDKARSGAEAPGKNGLRSEPATPAKDGARPGTGAGKSRTRVSAASGAEAPGKARTAPEGENPGNAAAAPGTDG
jgi:hypothetical protein